MMTSQELYDAALVATKLAYPPYSNLYVGAVLETEDGTLYQGANVEFASYGLTICAERTALVKAVTDGHRSFRRVGVARSDGLPISPCGMCRHSMADFSPGMIVVYMGRDGLVERPLHELLPDTLIFED
jgi:cytidine deaminase